MWARYIVQDVLHFCPDTWIIVVGTVILFVCTVYLVKLYKLFRTRLTEKKAGK